MEPLHGGTMLELGNKKNPDGLYKDWFVSLGFEHTSVDWNGLDGALPLDLRQPLDLGQFSMVTNIGTTEHVSEQEPVWRNLHEAVELHGVLVCVTPSPGDWWWHGEHYPTEDFYREFAHLNGYDIELLFVGNPEPRRNIYVRMVKESETAFQMPDPALIFYNQQRPR